MPRPEQTYPVEAESYWLDHAASVVGGGDEGIDSLAPHVARLSDLFTTARPEGGYPDYFSDPSLLSAYGVFFLPQGWTRAAVALRQCIELRGWRPPSRTLRVMDIGCGPGSCGVAAAWHLRSVGVEHVMLTGVDRSPAALAAFDAFARSVLGEGASVETRITDVSDVTAWPDESPDLIVAGFVLNELACADERRATEWIRLACTRLAPGGLLLVLEPALRFAAERLLRASDQVAAQGPFVRIAPQLDALPSPLLASGRDHWEHESAPWTAPASTELVNRRLHRDLREVRFSFAAFVNGTPALSPPDGSARIVSDIQIIKGLVRFIAVRKGVEQQVEVPTRGMSKHDIKAFAASLCRGAIVGYPGGDAGKLRLAGHEEIRLIWRP
ncbi:MAG: methyltransferase [Opitutales bacterium]